MQLKKHFRRKCKALNQRTKRPAKQKPEPVKSYEIR